MTATARKPQRNKIFISHASADAPLARELVKLLKLATTLPNDQIFCSSIEGHKPRTGDDFVKYIKDQLIATKLCIQLISPAFLTSDFCLFEVGGAWVMDDVVDRFPITVLGSSTEQLVGPLSNAQSRQLDRDGLSNLFDVVRELFGTNIASAEWEDHRDDFIERLPGYEKKCLDKYRTLPRLSLLRAARFAHESPNIHAAFHHLRDAASIRILHPDATEEEFGHRIDEYKSHLVHALDRLTTVFETITGAPCRFCIKQTEMKRTKTRGNERRPVFVTDLVRDGKSRSPQAHPKPDLVHENTDFEDILEHDQQFFFSNDLVAFAKTKPYKNSHGMPPEVGYISTIVWPIRKSISNIGKGDVPAAFRELNEYYHFLGFLCIDSEADNIFQEPESNRNLGHDINLGAAFADTLYNVIAPWSASLSLQPESTSARTSRKRT